MIASSNGNIICITESLRGESTGDQWIPPTKASDAELCCFLWSAPEQAIEQTIQTPVIWDAIALIMAICPRLCNPLRSCLYHSCGWIHAPIYLHYSRLLPLQWRHIELDGVSNHQPLDCLLNLLITRRSKQTSTLRVTGLCAGNSPGPVKSPHKRPVTRKMLPFDDVIMIQYSRLLPLCFRKHAIGPISL